MSPKIGENQRARNRCRTQHQHIHGLALGSQCETLAHTETVLFVHHHKRKRLEHDVVLDKCVGTDQQVDVTIGEAGNDLAPFLALLAAGQDRNAQAGPFGQRRDGLDMLAGKDFGRRHQGGLLAGLRHGRGGEQRDDRLARADIALKQPQHPHGLPQVVADRGGRLLLGCRQRVGKRVDDLVAQVSVAGVSASSRPSKLRAD